ncbi:GNAT family N-acetyltransferase [Thalassoglobus sp. JC818]|uniref:GNAT family N-acetyltransferase n=1 Tax=Thalassoglobus sp. JC818 TaxID=3232136 RepID=UPI00345A1C11
MVDVREFNESDWSAVWKILEPIFQAGKTYVFSPEITEMEAHQVWIDAPRSTFVAVDEAGTILGSYYLKPNQPGLGNHVCNCGYVVGESARGRGVASAMCEHSQTEAVARGFRSMQFNLVVSTNEGAIWLWKKLGFQVVGTLPGAFRHSEHGFVDAHVMFKQLTECE